jgi:uncharacterized membrane protein YphA (DoxX/SURF4 family)
MGALFGASGRGAAGYAPLVVRVLVGVVMAAHGWQKLQGEQRISARPSQGWAFYHDSTSGTRRSIEHMTAKS